MLLEDLAVWQEGSKVVIEPGQLLHSVEHEEETTYLQVRDSSAWFFLPQEDWFKACADRTVQPFEEN